MPRHKLGRLSRRNRTLSRAKHVTESKLPHCFVIHRGKVGQNTRRLTLDFRKVMEPNTATSLKHTKKNGIKDFVAVAGQLNVTHLVIFSQTNAGMYLKLCRLPRGPTLIFRLKSYALSKDVLSSLKKHYTHAGQYLSGPCLMTNLQPQEGDIHLQLTARMFLDMFPTITPHQVKAESIQRCCLINYDSEEKLFDFRHYSIRVVPVGVSKSVKKFSKRKLPDLSNYSDVSDFMTKAGVLSESEGEDDPAAQVMVDAKVARKKVGPRKSSVRLTELGPRLSLELLKIEEGLLDGKTLYHSIISRTDEEILQLEKNLKHKKQLKVKRRKEQEQNVEAKKKKKEEHKKKCLEGMGTKKETNEKDEGGDADVENTQDDDAQYYRDEVGEEPDADLFGKPWVRKKRKIVSGSGPVRKKFKGTDKKASTNDGSGKFFKKNEGQKNVKKIGMKSEAKIGKFSGRKNPSGKKGSSKKS